MYTRGEVSGFVSGFKCDNDFFLVRSRRYSEICIVNLFILVSGAHAALVSLLEIQRQRN